MKKKLKDSEKSTSMMFLEMLIEAGHTPKAVVVVNTKKEEEIYNTEEESFKNLHSEIKMCNNEHCNCENCTCDPCTCTAENKCECE